MITQRRRVFAVGLLVADVVALLVAYALGYLARFPDRPPFAANTPNGAAHLLMGVAGLVIWVLVLVGLGLYRTDELRRPGRTLGRLVTAGGLAFLLTGAALFLVQAKLASRLVLGVFMGLAAVLVGLNRLAGARVLRWWSRRSNPLVLIVGAGEVAAKLGERLRAEPELGVKPAGYLRVGDEPVAVPEGEVLGDVDELEVVLDGQVVDTVAIAHPSMSAGVIDGLALTCHEVGVDVMVVASEMDAIVARAAIDTLGGVPALRLSGSPQFRAKMASKRIFDLVVGSLLLGLSLPLMLLVTASVWLTSRGPALYRQERVGLNGRAFELYKFRSMVEGAESLRESLVAANEMSGPVFKVRDDPRVTRIGRLLRRFSIDELPQLFNVLRGDMSLVGPRPPLPGEVEEYDRWQRRRLSVKPGLTGVWQVSGRNDVDFADWMRLDLGYIDNWSPWLDLKILAKTIPAVISGRGAR